MLLIYLFVISFKSFFFVCFVFNFQFQASKGKYKWVVLEKEIKQCSSCGGGGNKTKQWS